MNIKFAMPKKISTNKIYSGVHWAVRKAQADLYHEYINTYAKEYELKPVTEYPIDIEYIFTFKGKPLDTTNATYMAKLCEDGLVKSGIIEDDDPEHVQYTGIYCQNGDEDLIEIIVT